MLVKPHPVTPHIFSEPLNIACRALILRAQIPLALNFPFSLGLAVPSCHNQLLCAPHMGHASVSRHDLPATTKLGEKYSKNYSVLTSGAHWSIPNPSIKPFDRQRVYQSFRLLPASAAHFRRASLSRCLAVSLSRCLAVSLPHPDIALEPVSS